VSPRGFEVEMEVDSEGFGVVRMEKADSV